MTDACKVDAPKTTRITTPQPETKPESTPAKVEAQKPEVVETKKPVDVETQKASRQKAAGSETSRAKALQASVPSKDKPEKMTPMSERELARGAHGGDVKALQENLNKKGAHLEVDGKFGPLTEAALKEFQDKNGLDKDGVCGPKTRAKLGAPLMEHHNGVEQMNDAKPGQQGENATATFDRVVNRGALSQEVEGRITVNGHSYDFKSGGYGRGNLPPGTYNVSMPESTSELGMVRDGVGFRAALSNKYDSRVGDTRSGLFIHPDGNVPGTLGCIGIQGDAAQLQRFRSDLEAECRRNGGHFTLRVG